MSKVILKNDEEIELIRESVTIVSKTLGMLASEIAPGITGIKLDKMAESFIRDHGALPGFLGLYDFPNTLCISPNNQVVHGIPNKNYFEEGDIISIDCGVIKNGYGVVRELVGHGIGKKMHEGPEIPNYGSKGEGKKFLNGMVLAIEPMINQGTHKIKQLNDGWTIVTEDNLPSAHFEHNIVLRNNEPELLLSLIHI